MGTNLSEAEFEIDLADTTCLINYLHLDLHADTFAIEMATRHIFNNFVPPPLPPLSFSTAQQFLRTLSSGKLLRVRSMEGRGDVRLIFPFSTPNCTSSYVQPHLFKATLELGGHIIGEGEGMSRAEANTAAARDAVQQIVQFRVENEKNKPLPSTARLPISPKIEYLRITDREVGGKYADNGMLSNEVGRKDKGSSYHITWKEFRSNVTTVWESVGKSGALNRGVDTEFSERYVPI